MKIDQLQDITLIHGDCMDFMRTLPDKAFSLAICDVPYGVGMDGKNNWSGSKHEVKDWDNESPSIEYFKELVRISENQILWGANHFISKIPIDSSCWIIWDKINDGFSFADAEIAWTSFNTAIRIFRYHRGQQTDKRIHPCQKPTALYKWLLKNYAKEGDTILDTHLGSGSSAIAAHDGHFKFTGIELDADYYEAAKKRIAYHQRQTNLF